MHSTDPVSSFENGVDGFIEEFALAIEANGLRQRSGRTIDRIRRASLELTKLFEELEQFRRPPTSVTSTDLERLRSELEAVGEVPMREMIERADALVQVIEAGIVEGDAGHLETLIAEAKALRPARAQSRASRQPRLEQPVRARCTTCDKFVVGRQTPAYNLDAIRTQLRRHETQMHGGITPDVADELTEARRELQAGATRAVAGRYIFEAVEE